jgi:hypothetical protein
LVVGNDDGAVKNAVNALAAPASPVGRGMVVDSGCPAAIVRPPERPNVPYVRLAVVADACGMSEHCVHHTHRPAGWGIPRDWLLIRGSLAVAYRLESLPDLVRSLRDGGHVAAADGLAVLIARLRGVEQPPEPTRMLAGWNGKIDRRQKLPWWRQGGIA